MGRKQKRFLLPTDPKQIFCEVGGFGLWDEAGQCWLGGGSKNEPLRYAKMRYAKMAAAMMQGRMLSPITAKPMEPGPFLLKDEITPPLGIV